VGARNSSNSNRLRELSEEYGVRAFLLNDASEFDPAWIEGLGTIGITAGASAPEELVEGLVERIGQIRKITVSELVGTEENVSFSLPRSLRDRPAARSAQN